MRAVVQRVCSAQVEVDGTPVASIGPGLVAFVAVERGDGPEQVRRLAERLVHLRLLGGPDGRMSYSLQERGGQLLLVSNLTVAAQTDRGRRVDLSRAADFETARRLFDALVEAVQAEGVPVAVGSFGATMRVTVVNDGPVTVVLQAPAPEGPSTG